MMLVLVTYDVSHPRALRRTARLLSTFGTRVQKSVFECHLTRSQLRHLCRRLEQERDRAPEGTGYAARCYLLGTLPEDRLVIIGDGHRTQREPYLVV